MEYDSLLFFFNFIIYFYILVSFCLRFPLWKMSKDKQIFCTLLVLETGVSFLSNFFFVLKLLTCWFFLSFFFWLNFRCWVCYKANICKNRKDLIFIPYLCHFLGIGEDLHFRLWTLDEKNKLAGLIARVIFVSSRYFSGLSSLVLSECREIIESVAFG